MLPLEHSAILLTCIKRYLVLKTNFGILFKWPLKTGFTVFITTTSGSDITPCNKISVGPGALKIKFLQKVGILHIKLKGMKCRNTFKKFALILAFDPVVGPGIEHTLFSESCIAYQTEGNEQ